MRQSKAEFRKLQLEWYRRLRDSGFVDIEGGRDLNQMSASTFSAGNREKGWIGFDFYSDEETSGDHALWGVNTQESKLERLSCASGNISVADTARGHAWRMFGQSANDLKRSKRRTFLLKVSEKGYIDPEDSEASGYSYSQAHTIFRAFCRDIGLPPYGLLGKGRKRGVRPNGRH